MNTTTTSATLAVYGVHGCPSSGLYMGTGVRPGPGQRAGSVTVADNIVTLTRENGRLLARHSVTTPFWFAAS
jgi:hypothetical protein